MVTDGVSSSLSGDILSCGSVVASTSFAATGHADLQASYKQTDAQAQHSLCVRLQGARVPKIVPRVIFELGPEAPQLASEQGMQVGHLKRGRHARTLSQRRSDPRPLTPLLWPHATRT